MTIRVQRRILIAAMILVMSSCRSRDEELARVASEGAERQAQQSQQVAEASAHLTAGAEQLIEAAGRSQESLITLQRQLQTEQAIVGQQRDRLEAERKTLALERQTSPLISGAILQVGLLVACLLPLLLAWRILHFVAVGVPDPDLTELLIDDLTAERPRLLSHSNRTDPGTNPDRLPAPE